MFGVGFGVATLQKVDRYPCIIILCATVQLDTIFSEYVAYVLGDQPIKVPLEWHLYSGVDRLQTYQKVAFIVAPSCAHYMNTKQSHVVGRKGTQYVQGDIFLIDMDLSDFRMTCMPPHMLSSVVYPLPCHHSCVGIMVVND
jgi:hypothetical protein